LVAAQSLLHCDLAAAHGSHHLGFAADDPPFGVGGWQIVYWESVRIVASRFSWPRSR
jgi:hypothetical protein